MNYIVYNQCIYSQLQLKIRICQPLLLQFGSLKKKKSLKLMSPFPRVTKGLHFSHQHTCSYTVDGSAGALFTTVVTHVRFFSARALNLSERFLTRVQQSPFVLTYRYLPPKYAFIFRMISWCMNVKVCLIPCGVVQTSTYG